MTNIFKEFVQTKINSIEGKIIISSFIILITVIIINKIFKKKDNNSKWTNYFKSKYNVIEEQKDLNNSVIGYTEILQIESFKEMFKRENTNNSKTKEDEFIDKKLKEVHNASILKMKKNIKKLIKIFCNFILTTLMNFSPQ